MILIRLTSDEQPIVEGYFKKAPIELMRYKAQAVMMRNNGLRIKDIAGSLLKSERTITRWMHDFSVQRIASLFSGLTDNENASKLTREQKEEIKKILARAPHEKGLPKEFWDVPQLKDYVKAEFGAVYESEQSYHYLLKFSNLSFKQPDVFDIKRDEAQIRQRMLEIRKELIPLAQDRNWVILASDETRILHEALTRRVWLKKGERTVIKVDRERESQYYVGFLNIATGRDHLIPMTWGNQEEIIQAVEHIASIYPGKKIAIVWDNVSFHKGKDLREKLKTGASLERIHLINFPPYAPDCNPQEMVWNAGKARIANHQFKTFAETKQAFESFVSTKIFNYSI